MNLEQIDHLLIDWQKKIDLVSQNLLDLQSLPTYQRLTGEGGFPQVKLTGITEKKVSPALQSMNDLFQYFELLILTINQALQIRKQIPKFLGSEKKLQEIEFLLLKSSIQLAVIPTPLAERGLLTAVNVTNQITPNDLLDAMVNTFEVTKKVVLEVDAVWLNLDSSLNQTEAIIKQLENGSQFLGQDTQNQLLQVNQIWQNLSQKIDSDPLGVSLNFKQDIQPILLKITKEIKAISQQKQIISDKLIIAQSRLKYLVDIHQKTILAFTESQEKILEKTGLKPPLPDGEIEALEQWLNRLNNKFKEGLLMPIEIGLEKLITKINDFLIIEYSAYKANYDPLEMRLELRGRLEALQAKALAKGMAENTVLSDLANEAKKLLYTRPTPLNQAIELVAKYEKYLNR